MLTRQQRNLRGLEMASRLEDRYENHKLSKARWYHRIILWAVPREIYKDPSGCGMVYRRLFRRIYLCNYFVWRKER